MQLKHLTNSREIKRERERERERRKIANTGALGEGFERKGTLLMNKGNSIHSCTSLGPCFHTNYVLVWLPQRYNTETEKNLAIIKCINS